MMIGGAGYVKYALDRAQAVVAAPDIALMGAAQADGSPTSAAPMQEAGGQLYTAIPASDNAVAAAQRLAAQKDAQFWSMILTLMCWCSLVITAGLVVGIYLVLRDRNSAPLRALTQSVKNMARGDMRNSIWGMERRDSIGELARAVDLARYQFSQMPDMTVLSDQGPVRLRFEGNTRSLFEAMIRVISRDSEQVHQQTAGLNAEIAKQQDTLALLVSRVEAVLQNVEKRAVSGDQQVRQSLQSMVVSAESLKHAQEHAADQLNRIVPYMHERARGLSEIAQLTGKQVAQVLQSLVLAERGLKANVAEGEDAIRKISSTADQLSERLFGAVNLLQASGKVLAETTEKTQSRLDEAIDNLRATSLPTLEQATAYLDDVTPRISGVVEVLEATQSKIDTMLANQTQATQERVDALTAPLGDWMAQGSTMTQNLAGAADRLRDEQARLDTMIGQFAARMDDLGERLDHHVSAMIDAKAAPLPPPQANVDTTILEQHLLRLTGQVDGVANKLALLTERQDRASTETPAREPSFVSDLLMEIKTGFEVMGSSLERMREQMTLMALRAHTEPVGLPVQINESWHQMAAQIESIRAGLTQVITQEVARIETRLITLQDTSGLDRMAAGGDGHALGDAQRQMEQQTYILSELVATLGLLDAHMQDLRAQVSGLCQAV